MTTTRRELAPRYDAASVEPAIYERWMDSRAFTPGDRATAGRGAVRHHPAAAERHRRAPPRPRRSTATVEDALHPLPPHARRRHALAPGRRPRQHRRAVRPRPDHRRGGESRASLGRERYLERMWQFMDETRDVIGEQHRRLGASLDWTRLRFTMDEVSARAVRVAFKRLWDAGLVYRGEALVNWCPRCRTTISDLENIHREETGTLWTIRYHLERRGRDAGSGRRGSASRRRGPRRSSATPPSRSIRTTSGIATSSGARRSCRSSDRRLPIVADEHRSSATSAPAR